MISVICLLKKPPIKTQNYIFKSRLCYRLNELVKNAYRISYKKIGNL